MMTPWRKGLGGVGLAALASAAFLGIGTIGCGGYEKPIFLPLDSARRGAISGRVVGGDGQGALTIVAASPMETAHLMAMPLTGSAVTVDRVRFGTRETVIELAEDAPE